MKPKCDTCGQEMLEIGGIGKDNILETFDSNGRVLTTGIVEVKLYQCPKCKDVKLD